MYSGCFQLKMVIFHSYVKLPEGMVNSTVILGLLLAHEYDMINWCQTKSDDWANAVNPMQSAPFHSPTVTGAHQKHRLKERGKVKVINLDRK